MGDVFTWLVLVLFFVQWVVVHNGMGESLVVKQWKAMQRAGLLTGLIVLATFFEVAHLALTRAH